MPPVLWALRQPSVDHQTLPIDRDGVRLHLGQQKLRMRQWIARILDPHIVRGRQQDPDGNVDCMLGAGRSPHDISSSAMSCRETLHIAISDGGMSRREGGAAAGAESAPIRRQCSTEMRFICAAQNSAEPAQLARRSP